jgi:succinate-semialdehyde dehydrogenase / glutarate-semialdehyde dehydrogenase
MSIISKNPATEEILHTFEAISDQEVQTKLDISKLAFTSWKTKSIVERGVYMTRLADIMREKKDYLATIMTSEMGTPLAQAKTEIEKCAFIADIFATESEKMLADEKAHVQAKEAYISFEPLGTLLHIAPWNYPFYLALRPVIPAIMAGNTVVLKHASNVPQVSTVLEELFLQAGFPAGVFQSLMIASSQVEKIIQNPIISVVSLIGSEKAGSIVASQAGKALKKTIMELGGNDPMIVLADADIDTVVAGAVQSRLRNCGQSCNASKRYVVHADVHTEFVTKLKAEYEKQVIGDPYDDTTDIGPLATESSLHEIDKQIKESVKMGANIVTGGKRRGTIGYFYEPTIITDATSEMPVFREEVFGPVATVIEVKNIEEAVKVANDSQYGLGASIWTADYDLAKSLIPQIEAGNVYINAIVRGDPKMPFGGIKMSGYGREFGEYGIKEFVNIKSVVVK